VTKTLAVRLAAALTALLALVAVATHMGDVEVIDLAVETSEASASRRVATATLSQENQDSDDQDGTVSLTLLHNNDGESKLLPDAEAGFPGVARFAAEWIEVGQASDADILLRVSSGDNFLASQVFTAGLALDDEPLYDALALRGLYEAMSFGNHDFDFGPEVAARFVDDFANGPLSDPVAFVATNLDVSAEPALQALVDKGRIVPSLVYTDPTSGLDVGVVSAVTPRLPNISSPRNVTVDDDIAGSVNAAVEALQDDGIDRIILISHLQGLSEDRELVPQLSGVDIVVAGGGDELLKNDDDSCQPDEAAVAGYPLFLTDSDGTTVPVVTTPGGYRCFGKLEVTFDADGVLVDVSGESIGVEIDGDSEDFALTRVEEPLTEALAELDASIVGSSDVDLDGQRNSVRTNASNLGELLADSLLEAGQAAPDFGGSAAVVAVQNGGGIRNDSVIAAGDITEADTFDIAPFANFVVTGAVPREQFKEMLEVGVSGLPDAEGTFPQISGFTMTVDATQAAREIDSDGDCSLIGDPGARVLNVTLDDGTEIVSDGQVMPGDDVVLATIDFLAAGGDCYPLDSIEFTKVGLSYQQALSSYIVDGLGGEISSDDYPEGGSRTTIDSEDADATQDDEDADATQDDEDADATEEDEDADTDGTDDDDDDTAVATGSSDGDDEDLARTGTDAWLWLIVAITGLVGGAMIAMEARRAGRLSLANRLVATQAWIPENVDPQDDLAS